MDELREQLAASCKKLRLSASLAGRAMTMEGETNQIYLQKLEAPRPPTFTLRAVSSAAWETS